MDNLLGFVAESPNLNQAAPQHAALKTRQQPYQQPVQVSVGCAGGGRRVEEATLISLTAMSADVVMQDQPAAHAQAGALQPGHGETMEMPSPQKAPQSKKQFSTNAEIHVCTTAEILDPQGQMQPSLQQPLPDLGSHTHRYQDFLFRFYLASVFCPACTAPAG